MRPPIIVYLIVIFAIFCSSNVISQSSSDYYPLKTGSEWTLEGYGTTPTITNKVIEIERIDGILYAKIEGKCIFKGD